MRPFLSAFTPTPDRPALLYEEFTMTAQQFRGLGAAAGAAVAIVFGADLVTEAAEPPPQTGFVLTSTTFRDGEMLPARTAFARTDQIPFCVGQNISPALAWANPPPGVKSFALTMVDQEGGGGMGDFDLVAYGIPPSVTSFAEGELN